jgi:hypothetical protein
MPDDDFWPLAEALYRVAKSRAYARCDAGASLVEWVDREALPISARTVQAMVQTYGWFRPMSSEVQDWARSLGWTAAQLLVGVVTEANFPIWRDKIAAGRLSANMLRDELVGHPRRPIPARDDLDLADLADPAALLERAKRLAFAGFLPPKKRKRAGWPEGLRKSPRAPDAPDGGKNVG